MQRLNKKHNKQDKRQARPNDLTVEALYLKLDLAAQIQFLVPLD